MALLPLYAGLLLAVASLGAGLAGVLATDPSGLPDVRIACQAVAMTLGDCRQAAISAGAFSLAAALLVVAIVPCIKARQLPWVVLRTQRKATFHGAMLTAAAMGGFALVLAQSGVQFFGPDFAVRVDAIGYAAPLVSLGNLAWPLLLQIVIVERRKTLRALTMAALVSVVAVSPYRGVLLAFVVFGWLVPLCSLAYRTWTSGHVALARRPLLKRTGAAAVVVAIVLTSGAMDTRNRVDTVPVVTAAGRAIVGERTVGQRIAQRIAYPVYQAVVAERLGEFVRLPSLVDEIASKFRLSAGPNLNELIYRTIYGGKTVGETTSLYYGEAVANTSVHPVFWMVSAPLILVLGMFISLRRGLPVGTIFGIQMWRSFLAGATTILPALLIQITLVAILSNWRATKPGRPGLKIMIGGKPLALILARIVPVVLAALVLAQAGQMFLDLQGRNLAIGTYRARSGCAVGNPQDFQEVVRDRLRNMGIHAVPSAGLSNDTMFVALPAASGSLEIYKNLQQGIEDVLVCSDKATGPKAEFISINIRQQGGIRPMDVFALCVNLYVLLLLLRRPARVYSTP